MSATSSPERNERNRGENERVNINAHEGNDEFAREVRRESEDRLMAFMEVKFEEFREVSDGLQRKLKKQEEKTHKFDKKTHKKQFLFNTELIEHIEEIQDAMERQKTTKVRKLLKEMNGKLEYRNKLIKLADRSKFGWLTVAEYEKDNLADGSDDEKRMKNSEKGAEKIDKEKKAKEKQDKEKNNNRFHPYARQGGSSTFSSREQHERSENRSNSNGNYHAGSSGSAPRFRNAPPSSSNYQQRSNNSGYYGSNNQNYSRPNKPCWGCGRLDHLRKDCPYC